MKDLSVIISHYKTPDILWRCLEHVMAAVPEAEVIVVDADSQDGTLESLAQHYPSIQGITTHNHSLAHAVNTGLAASQQPIMLQMNADVFIGREAILHMREALEQNRVGLVGPVCHKDGVLQNQGVLYRRHYWELQGRECPWLKVNWLSGCCQMLRRSTYEAVGGMSTKLRFYNEDIEWSWRIRQAGWHCVLVSSRAEHLGGSSTPRQPAFVIEGYRGGMLLSQWYKPRWYQSLHRQAVLSAARYQQHYSSDPIYKEAFRSIYLMFQANDYSQSPFGPTLNSLNPHFRF